MAIGGIGFGLHHPFHEERRIRRKDRRPWPPAYLGPVRTIRKPNSVEVGQQYRLVPQPVDARQHQCVVGHPAKENNGGR